MKIFTAFFLKKKGGGWEKRRYTNESFFLWSCRAVASALRVRGGGLVKLHRKENANVEREQKQDVTIFCQNCICGAAYWHEEEIYFNLAFIAARARVCLLLVHLAFIGIYWLPTQACCEAGRAPASLSPVPPTDSSPPPPAAVLQLSVGFRQKLRSLCVDSKTRTWIKMAAHRHHRRAEGCLFSSLLPRQVCRVNLQPGLAWRRQSRGCTRWMGCGKGRRW